MFYEFYPETDYSEEEIVVAAFYKFVKWDHKAHRDSILKVCEDNDVKGIILLAEEGINSTSAGTREGIDALLAHLRSIPELSDLSHKESYTHIKPFRRIKVRLKQEIVTIKDSMDPLNVGTYIDAKDWNTLISDPEVVLIDTRNDYEFDIGTFEGAINPNIEEFSEFPEWMLKNVPPAENKKVAMFCTGGIRCEKSTAWALAHGYEEVYHLKDGILKYLEEIPQDKTMWNGDCFIFDDRQALDHNLKSVKERK